MLIFSASASSCSAMLSTPRGISTQSKLPPAGRDTRVPEGKREAIVAVMIGKDEPAAALNTAAEAADAALAGK
mgnify:CR=1 FL=1